MHPTTFEFLLKHCTKYPKNIVLIEDANEAQKYIEIIAKMISESLKGIDPRIMINVDTHGNDNEIEYRRHVGFSPGDIERIAAPFLEHKFMLYVSSCSSGAFVKQFADETLKELSITGSCDIAASVSTEWAPYLFMGCNDFEPNFTLSGLQEIQMSIVKTRRGHQVQNPSYSE